MTADAEAVAEVGADRLRVERSAFDADARLDAAPLGADSLDRVEIAEAIEARLGVHVPDEALAEVETVGDLQDWVAEHG
ncbi:MAG: acyl carrier protein [Halobacteriaceae archaeon]